MIIGLPLTSFFPAHRKACCLSHQHSHLHHATHRRNKTTVCNLLDFRSITQLLHKTYTTHKMALKRINKELTDLGRYVRIVTRASLTITLLCLWKSDTDTIPVTLLHHALLVQSVTIWYVRRSTPEHNSLLDPAHSTLHRSA